MSPSPPEQHDAVWSSDLRFRTIFEQSPVSTQIFSRQGDTLAVNRAWEELWGVTLEALGQYNILDDEQLVRKGIMPHILRGFAGETVAIPAIKYQPDETLVVEGAVAYRWVRALIYPVKDERGAIQEIVLMHEDITEQRRAEEALLESEARFRAVFDSAPVGISLIDPEGRYVAVNPARQRMLGYSEEEMLGQNFLTFTHDEDVEYDQGVNTGARLRGEDNFHLEKRFVRKDGSVEWARITAAVVRDEAGKVRYSVSIAEDITAQRQLEQQKDQFLSAIAHDLRTPLTAIKGRAQIVRRRIEAGRIEPEVVREGLDRIDEGTDRMIALINELLEVANIQLGRPLEAKHEPVDLVALVKAAVHAYAPSTDRHTISVRSGATELTGNWDAARLDRVLANLLSNAVKYSPEGGDVIVDVRHVDAPDGGWALLSVQDHGIGILPDDLPVIFDRFHRGKNVAGTIAGMGIGLAAVREIVESHGGTVTVSSTAGAGAIFTVRLPLNPPGSLSIDPGE